MASLLQLGPVWVGAVEMLATMLEKLGTLDGGMEIGELKKLLV